MMRQVSVDFFRKNAQLAVLFGSVYYPLNALASVRRTYVVAFDWERSLPFIPWLYAVYFSALCLPLILIVYFRSTEQTRRWAFDMSITILLCGVIFLLLPTSQLDDSALVDSSAIQNAIWFITGRHNLFPSLHVALSTVIIRHATENEPRRVVRGAFWFWLIALACATVLTRQHNIADVLGGAVIGFFGQQRLHKRS